MSVTCNFGCNPLILMMVSCPPPTVKQVYNLMRSYAFIMVYNRAAKPKSTEKGCSCMDEGDLEQSPTQKICQKISNAGGSLKVESGLWSGLLASDKGVLQDVPSQVDREKMKGFKGSPSFRPFQDLCSQARTTWLPVWMMFCQTHNHQQCLKWEEYMPHCSLSNQVQLHYMQQPVCTVIWTLLQNWMNGAFIPAWLVIEEYTGMVVRRERQNKDLQFIE